MPCLCPRLSRVAAIPLLTVLVLAAAPRLLPAQDEPSRLAPPPASTFRLQDDPRVLEMKRDAIWSEYRLEMRERAERARNGREARRWTAARHGSAGRKVQPERPDEDQRAGRLIRGPAFATSIHATQSTPSNVLVNDRSLDGFGAAQSEESVAMVGSLGLAAWNNGQGFYNGSDTQTAAWTSNGGASWSSIAIPHPSGAQIAYWFSDPVVTVNEKTGTFYYCGLTTFSASTNGISVASGHFSGGTFVWDAVVPVRNGSNSSLLFDKQWIAADSSNGNLYLSYTVFGSVADTIVTQRSTDGGAHWDNPIVLNSTGFGNVSGSRPAVGPNSEVYVTWQEAGPTFDFMRYRRSTTQGASYGAQATAATEFSNYGTGAPGFNRARGITFPGIAVDRSRGPHRGRVSLIWNESLNFYDDAFSTTPRLLETETNNNFSRATPFTVGQNLEGALPRGDLDVWSFAATQGTTYQFYVDSLKSTLWYTLRVFCGADTLTRLAFSGDPDSTSPSSGGGRGLIVWTAPTSGTYDLRIAQTAGTGGYRILTTVAAHGAEPGRDQRDIVTAFSDDGTSWSTPARINDDPPWFDDWLPEVGVSREGYPYAMWFDWRDALSTCGGSSGIYASRSLNGGGSWVPSVAVTDTLTRWTQIAANIAPNQGDYNGMFCSDVTVLAWADGRRSDPDVFATRVALIASTSCPPDSSWGAGTTHTLHVTVTQPNLLFANSYAYSLTSQRSWPGVATSGSTAALPAGPADLAFTVTVPDTAAIGDNRLCLRLTQPDGVVLDSCCVRITVTQVAAVDVGGPAGLELRGAWPNPASRHLTLGFTLPSGAPAQLELIDLAGRRVLARDVGALGAGAHQLDLSREAAALRPGVYSIRLTQGGRALTRKVAIVR